MSVKGSIVTSNFAVDSLNELTGASPSGTLTVAGAIAGSTYPRELDSIGTLQSVAFNEHGT